MSFRLRWQNLNEGPDGQPKGWPHHGRCWLWRRDEVVLRFSWDLWSRFCGVSIGSDDEDGGIALFAALPPVAFWLTLPAPLRRWLDTPFWARWNERHGGHKGSHRYTALKMADVSVHDWTLFWSFLCFDWGWSRQMPRWMSGSWRPGRTFFGRWIYETKMLEQRAIVVPMPEGEYRGEAELRQAVRGHRFSPLKHRNIEVEIRLEQPIPYSGKGENSWDCGLDGLHGMSCQARSIEDAIGRVVASVLETRRRRGDPAKWPMTAQVGYLP